MGAWGVYDDECDGAHDMFCEFLDYVNMRYDQFEDYAKNYPEEVYERYEKYIETVEPQYSIIGMTLTLLKMTTNQTPQIQPLYGIPDKSSLPSLPLNFPESVRLRVLAECRNKRDLKEWDGDLERKEAVEQEIFLFSRGKEGHNGQIIQNNFERILKQS